MNFNAKFQMAGFRLRLGATMLDSLFIVVFILFLLGIVFGLSGSNPSLIERDSLILIGFLMYFFGFPLLIILYQSVFESSKFQGTPGKMILKIQVIDYNGDRISFARSLLRNLSRILSSLTMMIGYLMITFSDNKQALHDMVAKTFVIRKRFDFVTLNNEVEKNLQVVNDPVIIEVEKSSEPVINKEDHNRFMPH